MEMRSIGYGIDQVNPIRHFMSTLQENLDDDSFMEIQNRLQDKLSPKILWEINTTSDISEKKVNIADYSIMFKSNQIKFYLKSAMYI